MRPLRHTEALPDGHAGTRSAFGLGFRGDPLAGLHDVPRQDRVVAVVREEPPALDERWAAAPAPLSLSTKRFESGETFLSVRWSAGFGYRVWARGLGLHLVSQDGATVWTWSAPSQPWLARKFAAAQLLPLLAILNGIEVLHAGAVEIDGGVVGLAAASGTGKTSTAAHLIAGGAGFVADDGLGLEPGSGGVLAHPGPRTLNLETEQLAAIAPDQRARLGVELGRSVIGERTEIHLEPASVGDGLPLAGLLYLERTSERLGTVEALDGPAALILGSSHAAYLATPERRLRQLDVVSAIVAGTRVARLTIGTQEPAARIAERVREWLGGA